LILVLFKEQVQVQMPSDVGETMAGVENLTALPSPALPKATGIESIRTKKEDSTFK